MGERVQIIFDRPFVDLTKDFNVGGRINAATVPGYLYNEYVDLYRRSDDMHRKLEMVMDDGEHQLAMEEGMDFFKLPNTRYLRKELGELRGILDSFDPYHTTFGKSGKVKLKDVQIQGFFNLFAKDYDIVHGLFETFRNTDYLKYHRHLRDVQKVKYAGPTSLQEIVNVFFGIARAQNKQRAYLKELAAPRAG